MRFSKDSKIFSIIFICSFVIGILTINRCNTIVLDSICYIADIARGDLIFHPHHLFYHVGFFYWFKIMSLLGIRDIVTALPILNVLSSSVSISFIYLIYRKRFELSYSKSILFLILPAFSYGFWIVSTSVNVYAIPFTCLIICYYLYTQQTNNVRKWLLIGIFQAIAIIFNQWNVFISIIIFFAILFSKERKIVLKKYFLLYLSTAAIIPMISYFLVMRFYFGINSLIDMYKWITFYGSVFSWTFDLGAAFKQAAMGIGQTISAPFCLFKADTFAKMFHTLMQSSSFAEELFFVRKISSVEASIYLFLLFIILLMLGYILAYIVLNIRTLYRKHSNSMIYLLFWIFISSIMPLFWSGYNQRYWFTQTMATFILIALSRSKIAKWEFKDILILASGILLVIVNYQSIFKYSSNIDYDLTYCQLNEIKKTAKSNDIIIYNEPWTLGFYSNVHLKNVKTISVGNWNTDFENRDNLERLKKIKSLYNNNIYIVINNFDDIKNQDIKAEVNKLTSTYKFVKYENKALNFKYLKFIRNNTNE